MAKKIIGWVLLAVGVLIIVWGVWSSYSIFTVQKPVPQVFEIPENFRDNAEKKEAEEGGEGEEPLSEEEEAQRKAGEIIKEQIGEILPFDFITRFFNLIAWSIFMGILIIAGGKIASIGIKLLAVRKENDNVNRVAIEGSRA